ncbi:ECF transporter S component [Aerococcaceae bacterium DSM 111020]|nr:ECF transporter S component [Aerococcaceae bacterium DSM 111020]
MKRVTTRELVFLGILSAFGVILRLLDFPILPAAPFLKVDLSDLTGLIGLLTSGPLGLMLVSLVRDLINYIIGGGQSGIPIGSIMSFAGTMALFLPTHFILKRFPSMNRWGRLILMGVASTLSLTVTLSLINYYVALPIFVTVMNFPIDDYFGYVISLVVPFNLIKGVIVSIGQAVVIESLVPLMYKRRTLFEPYNQTLFPIRKHS